MCMTVSHSLSVPLHPAPPAAEGGTGKARERPATDKSNHADASVLLAPDGNRKPAPWQTRIRPRGTVRPVIAAKILNLSEKTVRTWAAAGLLSARQRSPRLLLDVPSVYAVSHVLREIRPMAWTGICSSVPCTAWRIRFLGRTDLPGAASSRSPRPDARTGLRGLHRLPRAATSRGSRL
jgi:hypothetical protein